jgi:hypothetical protein
MAGIHAIASSGGGTDFTNLTISGGTGVVSLRSLADAAGYPGSGTHTITFTLPLGQNRTGSPGADAIDTGSWPGGTTLNLIIDGQANGGAGTVGIASGVGGDAVNCQYPIAITVNATGALRGAGGSGGNGGGSSYEEFDSESSSWIPTAFYNGGAGGAGAYGTNAATSGSPGGGGHGGTGGTGGAIATAGSAGTAGETDTSGGTRYVGFAGGSGAQPGYAVRKNGNTVPVTNNGGTISGLTA